MKGKKGTEGGVMSVLNERTKPKGKMDGEYLEKKKLNINS